MELKKFFSLVCLFDFVNSIIEPGSFFNVMILITQFFAVSKSSVSFSFQVLVKIFILFSFWFGFSWTVIIFFKSFCDDFLANFFPRVFHCFFSFNVGVHFYAIFRVYWNYSYQGLISFPKSCWITFWLWFSISPRLFSPINLTFCENWNSLRQKFFFTSNKSQKVFWEQYYQNQLKCVCCHTVVWIFCSLRLKILISRNSNVKFKFYM